MKAPCRDYCEGLRDSLDLVPIGAWYGQGRKTGWFSPFLMAAWDPEKEEFQSVCRCMSGFTDVFYSQVRETAPNAQSAAIGDFAEYCDSAVTASATGFTTVLRAEFSERSILRLGVHRRPPHD